MTRAYGDIPFELSANTCEVLESAIGMLNAVVCGADHAKDTKILGQMSLGRSNHSGS